MKKLKDFMSCYANVGNFRLKHIFKIMIAKESHRSYNEMATENQQAKIIYVIEIK